MVLLGALTMPGCLFLYKHRVQNAATQVTPGDQPDKILYEKATHEIDHGRYDVGRLTLQTLINTYPDSEFLAKAKLAIADSYYNEGGVSGLTQADAEYKDFITFFPTAPEAPEAQYRVAMAHYRMMAKADRDETEARLAEVELKEFLLKYPDSPTMIKAKARLREVQEVLAQGDYLTANFYMMRGAYPAAKSRYQEIIDKYPNFSRGDEALWELGLTLEKLKAPQMAVPYYGQILRNFPLSPHVEEARQRLVAMHQAVPRPTKAILARAQADALHQHRRDLLSKMTGVMSGSPDTSATLHGPVRIGGPQPGEVEVAKTGPGGAPAGNATIVAQPVGAGSLSSGKVVDPKTGQTANDKPAPDSTQTVKTNDQNPSADDTPPKKKSKLHKLKKLIKPF
ncbi:MAG: outer membrane protein assembly factor BamD [Acidobacteriia bacterium]|nr:outer membrane protein assembly factor BamD [Terriglobia bacterium]